MQTVHSVGKSVHPQHGSLRAWGYLTVRVPCGVGGEQVGRGKMVPFPVCTLCHGTAVGVPFVSLLYPTGAVSSRDQERRIVLCQPVHSVGKSLHPQHGSLRAWGYLTVRAPRGVGGGGGVGRERHHLATNMLYYTFIANCLV